tara:strand:- start:17594 stop:17896 length:303 start_codon:yes stop_codon:yes gene_type:complete
MSVYIVQEVKGRNVLPAQQYGELELMLPPGDIVLSSQPTIKRLRNKLKNFSDKDYILTMGDPIAIALSGIIASQNNNGRVKFLKWDRQEKKYYPVKCDLR